MMSINIIIILNKNTKKMHHKIYSAFEKNKERKNYLNPKLLKNFEFSLIRLNRIDC